jgi:tetratricopeptide (TPR) repeat protein
VHARDAADLDAAAEKLTRAGEINPEETGVSLVLGEVEVLRGRLDVARQRFNWVVRTNPQSGEAFFLLAYLDLTAGNREAALARLADAVAARGEDWKPPGVIAEGETKRKMHEESTPFEDWYNAWDGELEPEAALAELRAYLDGR